MSEIINHAHQTYGFITNKEINNNRNSARLTVGQVREGGGREGEGREGQKRERVE